MRPVRTSLSADPVERTPVRLAELASVGPFFALRTDDKPDDEPDDTLDDEPDGGAWLPFASPEQAEAAVRARVEVVARRLGTADRRVAASVAFQGIAGRLLSVALGSAVLTGRLPDLGDARLRWYPGRTAPEDLWLPAPRALPAEADPAGRLRERVLGGPVAALHRAVAASVPVSRRLLWGNASSALAGSLRVLDTWCREHGRPEDAGRARALAREVLDDPVLRGTGTLTCGGAGVSFVRDTCCLYYRAVPGGMCGDCVLRHPPRAR
ncbi:(2Fe-2S)-binding protein [Streptomyces gamaensis]|uniref:(2Fe-2S)-binding protein n=1 Tax=Streptomyces gamaensis TaxID=1763542 RepID=A0ABW0Z169_9ACTN